MVAGFLLGSRQSVAEDLNSFMMIFFYTLTSPYKAVIIVPTGLQLPLNLYWSQNTMGHTALNGHVRI